MSSDSRLPEPSSNELALQRTHLADERTDLAVIRTLIALERTLMAWVRTATSLISFGFTIYKFFEQFRPPGGRSDGLLQPRGVALVLIALGVGGLLLATAEYQSQISMLRDRFAAYGPFRKSTTAGVAATVSGLGIVGFVLVFLRQ
jgi:putative membrane protein